MRLFTRSTAPTSVHDFETFDEALDELEEQERMLPWSRAMMWMTTGFVGFFLLSGTGISLRSPSTSTSKPSRPTARMPRGSWTVDPTGMTLPSAPMRPHDDPMNILGTAISAAKWSAGIGFACGVLYSFGGLIVDLLTIGLNGGTALAFMALIGMPLLFGAVGFALGAFFALLRRAVV